VSHSLGAGLEAVKPHVSGNRISRFARVTTALASLSLMGSFFLPLWRVQVVAPQYPEGLGMRIGINSIRGATIYDLDNINGLNHYIGMQRITPDAIPELRMMPWILGALIVAGLIVALIGRRLPLYGWFLAFFAASAGGLADFWRWEYDYGHNIDFEHAIIKIPGMNYQPPLMGVKQLLNFTAVSWPDAGGWLAFIAFALATLAVVTVFRSTTSKHAHG
jgi:copper chaperone NosL